eukprot:1158702-Pelagomonas_calceolata.AAC.16
MPAKRPRALRKGSLTSKLAKVSPKGLLRHTQGLVLGQMQGCACNAGNVQDHRLLLGWSSSTHHTAMFMQSSFCERSHNDPEVVDRDP